MRNITDEFIKWAEEKGWEIRRYKDVSLNIPSILVNRYAKIPNEFSRFLELVDVCITPDEKSWFICINDYNGISDLAFTWDEFEKISLEAANRDVEWKEEITKFWDRFLPIAMSVRDGYSYYALDTASGLGSIVCGCEPEFEDAKQIATSFLEFLDDIMAKKVAL